MSVANPNYLAEVSSLAQRIDTGLETLNQKGTCVAYIFIELFILFTLSGLISELLACLKKGRRLSQNI